MPATALMFRSSQTCRRRRRYAARVPWTKGGWGRDAPGADDQERSGGTQPEGPPVWADPVDQAGSSPADGPAVAAWSLDDLMRVTAGGPAQLREPRVVYSIAGKEEPPRRPSGGSVPSLAAAVLIVVGVVGGL